MQACPIGSNLPSCSTISVIRGLRIKWALASWLSIIDSAFTPFQAELGRHIHLLTCCQVSRLYRCGTNEQSGLQDFSINGELSARFS